MHLVDLQLQQQGTWWLNCYRVASPHGSLDYAPPISRADPLGYNLSIDHSYPPADSHLGRGSYLKEWLDPVMRAS